MHIHIYRYSMCGYGYSWNCCNCTTSTSSDTVQVCVNTLRNWVDLRAQLILNFIQAEPVSIGYKIDGNSQVTVTPRAPYSVQVCLAVFGVVKIDDHIHGLDVNSSSE
eukprot:NODE_2448_length_694_cov_57.108527_g1997_i0.p3 GENE.NODE_2448_length_694_cov_57.108527_g1997_i0~~NODE_2448_length_694_cov_57.108527_g1997_i0.p3  ORF type:complete len:107 (-),score=9.38 NODE_2448_length_694_cov_57.108527_g1997_i0:34-354(-)